MKFPRSMSENRHFPTTKPTWAEEESHTSSSKKQRKSRGLVITLELERNKALGKPWKNKSLGYIPSPKGERSKA